MLNNHKIIQNNDKKLHLILANDTTRYWQLRQRVKILTNAGTHDAFVMIRINADIVLLQFKCKLAELAVLKLVLAQVRPAPDPCVHNVRKTLPACYLQTRAPSPYCL